MSAAAVNGEEHGNGRGGNGCQQLIAIINKNYIEKKRNIRNSCCEYCSHLIILLLLVFGYGLSEITHYDAKMYSSLNVTIPPDWIASDNIRLSGIYSTFTDYLSGPLPTPTFDIFVLTSRAISNVVGEDRITSLITSSSFGQTYGNLLTLGSLHFAPDSPEVDSLIKYFNDTTATFQTLNVRKHKSEGKAIKYIQSHLEEYTWALIVVHSVDESNINYEIRLNYTTLPNTNEVVNWITIGLDTTYQRYYLSGFLSLQDVIDDWAFERINGIINATENICRRPTTISMPFPTAPFDQNIFFLAVGFLLGLAMTMATMYPMSRLVKSIVEEKESKMREVRCFLCFLEYSQVMKIMGLRDWAHQGAWFITAFILFFWIAISSTFISHNSFLPKTDPFLLFLYFFTFALSEVTFSFLIASFFSKAKLASMVAPVILFASILPRFIFYSSNPYEQQQSKYFASLLSPTAFTFGADILANYEYAGVGVQVYNMDQGLYSFSGSIRMMFADFIIYGILAWYLDQVMPLDVGTPKHPLFIFHLSYWFPVWSRRNIPDFEFSQPIEYDPSSAQPTSSIQPILENDRQQSRVLISHLRKRYSDGKLAVKDFSLTLLEGQITCLLGHNGAGKTTTLSILTGLIEPTRGDCLIWNYKLSTELPAIRQLTGICPQQNVIFPSLTVKEHLMFFGKIKGFSGQDLINRVNQCIEDVGLVEKRDVLAHALSGGMKRKLCLAMALIGDPKFVLLDEPTSGMDPYSRRSTWELLQKSKAGRVIVLTTHFMDEADLLGDRIAIMSEGKLRCSGSPLFLKTRFGAGYILSISRTQHGKLHPNIDQDLLHFVQRAIPEATMTSSIAGEVIISLPITSVPSFGQLFQLLKAHKSDYGVSSYGICITTLEQVFIQLAHENRPQQNMDDDDEDDDDYSPFFMSFSHSIGLRSSSKRIVSPVENVAQEVEMVAKEQAIEDNPSMNVTNGPNYLAVSPHETSGAILGDDSAFHKEGHDTEAISHLAGWRNDQMVEKVLTQLWELLRKRWVIAQRDLNGLFFQLVLPAMQIALVLSILMINVNPAGRTLTLNAAMFPVHPTALYSQGSNISPFQALLKSNFNQIRMSLYETNSSTSLESSEYMLNTYSEPEGNRYGAFVFDDRITTNVTVDWMWVRNNSQAILNNSDLILSILEDTGLIPPDSSWNDLLSIDETFQQNIPSLVLDYLNTSISENQLNISEAIRLFVDDIFENTTTITFNNETYTESEIIEILESILIPLNSSSIINITDQDTSSITGSFSIDSIQIISGEVILIGVTLEINNITIIDLGNITLTNIQLQTLLPNSTITYTFQIPSPYSILHNTSSPHAVAAFKGELNAAVLQSCSNTASSPRYKSKNHPLPLTAQESLEIQVILSIFASLFILIPLCYIPASFVVFVVREKESKSKHLQIVSSISPYLYWIATYIWDMILYCILIGLILLTFFSYGANASRIFIASNEAIIAVFLLLFLYGTSAIPISYIYSFAFNNHSTAQISIMTINFFTGFVAVLAYYIMVSIPSTKSLGEQLVHIFRFFPPYNIGEGLINISAAYFSNELLDDHVSYLSYGVTGRNIIHLVIETGVYMTIVLLTEANWIRQIYYYLEKIVFQLFGYELLLSSAIPLSLSSTNSPSSPSPPSSSPPPLSTSIDEDIINEMNIVEKYSPHDASTTPNSSDYMLVLRNIIKTYPPTLLLGQPKHAVRGINLACAAGERFGLLGINGAGKSTTLNILTGDIQPTKGEAYIAGLPLSDPSTRDLIGYCPQTDPLLDLMTGYETLWFFGRVRGLEKHGLHLRCLQLIDQVGLTKHAFKPCGSYSGGNKRFVPPPPPPPPLHKSLNFIRKLSLAVALIGNPKVLFLDEPSSGMDPEARRHMWEVIAQVSEDRSIIITTHSMEECEAICTRIGIMVSGRLQCLGSSQHLKSRYGAGYQLDISFSSPTKKQSFIQLFTHTSSANATTTSPCPSSSPAQDSPHPLIDAMIEEEHSNYIRLKLSQNIDLADTFTFLEKLKFQEEKNSSIDGGSTTSTSSCSIQDYSLSQSTLEQIFINFAKHQHDEEEKDHQRN